MTATGLLFKVTISSVVVGVLGVLICIGGVFGGVYIVRLRSSPSCCGVLLKKSKVKVSLLLDSIEVCRKLLFIVLLDLVKDFSISIELLEDICWSMSHLVLSEKCDRLKSFRSTFPDLFKLDFT